MNAAHHRLRPGAALGRYVVVSKLGAGGMGVVFAGYDPELDRKVALKVLHHGGALGSEGRTRLLREAQALAKLSHPNVVAIHDVGTVDDDVWLAIEFVAGGTFGEWLRAVPRSWREVLEVMTAAGRGLAAAHAAGLVHRDFKPDNVMVGDDGRTRVMDFGLARASSDAAPTDDASDGAQNSSDALALEDTAAPAVAPSLEDTAAPAAAPSLADTAAPAPSEVASRPGSAAARSALREVLTRAGAIAGTPAYMAPEQFAGAPTDGRTDQFSFCVTLWEALYRQRPFTGETFAELAANVLEGNAPIVPRTSDVPAWLGKVLLRGLARVPDDRWPTMADLLAALASGRGRARRRQAWFAVGAVAATAMGVVGLRMLVEHGRVVACEDGGTAIDTVWNDDERARVRAGLLATGLTTAEVTADKVMPWLDAQANAWREATTQACLDTEVRGVASFERLTRARWCLDDARIQLESVRDALEEADAAFVHNAVATAASLTRIADCRDPDHLDRMPLPPLERRANVEALRVDLARVSALDAAARYEPALELARDTVVSAVALDWPPLVADARQRLASVTGHLGDNAAAAAELEQAFFDAGNAGDDDLAAQIADGLVLLVGERLARHDEALRWARWAEMLRPDREGVALARHLHHMAAVRAAMGEQSEALALYERVLAIDEAVLGEDHPSSAITLSNIGVARQAMGDDAGARERLERSLAIRERVLGERHPEVASTLVNLAIVRRNLGDLDGAENLLRRAIAIREEVLGADSTDVALALNNLANLLRDRGAIDEATTMFERALAILERRLGPEHPHVAIACTNLAWLRLEAKAYADARALFERAVASSTARLGPDHPNLAGMWVGLSEIAEVEGRHAEAIALAERSLKIREGAEVPGYALAESRFQLARVLWADDRARARSLAEAARADYLAAGEGAEKDAQSVAEWLRSHG